MAGDYMASMTRQSGSVTISEHRARMLRAAYQQGQRDAEQGWSENLRMWDYDCVKALKDAYHRGYSAPRI